MRLADERLEDEDLLEMLNAGLIPRVVTDDYNARFWARVFPDIRMYPKIPLAQGGRIAWAFRKQSPRLKAVVDSFVAGHKVGTADYNDAYRRYFASTKWVKNAASEKELAKFRATVELFKKYGEQYDFDYLMMTAQGYQESEQDQRRRSASGAVGVMQVLPSTGRLMKVGDIHQLEPNIHAGVKCSTSPTSTNTTSPTGCWSSSAGNGSRRWALHHETVHRRGARRSVTDCAGGVGGIAPRNAATGVDTADPPA